MWDEIQGIGSDEVQLLARMLSVEEIPRGRIWQLDTCESVYVIREGECKVRKVRLLQMLGKAY